MTDILKEIRPLLVIFLGLAVITGIIYPLAVYIIGQVAFPYQANGSLLKDKNGTVVGSELIGQQFTDDKYFWPARPTRAVTHIIRWRPPARTTGRPMRN